MNIKNIIFTLENCDTITIPGQYIGDICLENLKTEIKRLALNWVDKIELCESFFIEIHNFANTLDYAFSEDSDCFKDEPYYKFDRLCNHYDITQVTINLYDYNDKEYSYDYLVSYSEEDPNVLGSPNIYQYTYISDLGHLYILIDPKLKLDDVLDYEYINNKEAMHLNFELLGIEEENEDEYSYDKDDNNENDEDIDKDNQ